MSLECYPLRNVWVSWEWWSSCWHPEEEGGGGGEGAKAGQYTDFLSYTMTNCEIGSKQAQVHASSAQEGRR